MNVRKHHAVFFMIFLSSGTLFSVPAHAVSQEDLKKGSAFNESAIQKMKSGDLDGAETDLLAAMEYSDQNEKVKKNLGVVYFEKGARAIREGKFFDAQSALKAALEIEPENAKYSKAYASSLFTEANARAKNGQDEAALRLYEQATQVDKNNIQAWTHAAHYAWTTQRLDLARKYLERAKAIDPGDKNVSVLEEDMKKSSSEVSFESHASQHFILSADPEYMEAAGSAGILRDLETAYNEVSYQLNIFPQNKITVVFYPAEDFHEHWKLPARVSGYYDGKLRIPYAHEGTSFETMKPMIKHELTHAFVSIMTQRPIPQWMNEGLAQWMEGKKLEPATKDALVTYQITQRLPDIEHLDKAFSAQKNPYNNTEMTLAYMKAFSVTDYLIETYGLYSLVQFTKDHASSAKENELFKKYFHASTREIESHWVQWLERKKSYLLAN